MKAIAVSSQYPFEPVVEQLFKGLYHCTRSPYQSPGRLEQPGFGLPPEMVAEEQKRWSQSNALLPGVCPDTGMRLNCGGEV